MAIRRRSRHPASDDVFPGFVDVAEIGSGSLATVYRASEADTGRAVALKLLNVRDVSPRALESFQRESIALGAVSAHPNIVTLYRSFQTADGRPVLVLELCRGSIFDQLRTPGGLSAQQVVGVGIKMAAALETAHRAEILHRDVKPQNILITEFGEPALADFGVAMLQASSQTTSGLFDFTTLHVAPELLEGRPTSAATDVYELASTLYQLLAGQAAFRAYEGESPASVILRILRDPVRPLVTETVPAALSDLLVSSMSKDQAGRPASAAEFAEALGQVERAQGWPATTFLVRDVASVIQPLNRPVQPVRSVRPAPGSAVGLSRRCAQGHLVSGAVLSCPICGSAELEPNATLPSATEVADLAGGRSEVTAVQRTRVPDDRIPTVPPAAAAPGSTPSTGDKAPAPNDRAWTSRIDTSAFWNSYSADSTPTHRAVRGRPAGSVPSVTVEPDSLEPDAVEPVLPSTPTGHDPWDPDGDWLADSTARQPHPAVASLAPARPSFDSDSSATRPRHRRPDDTQAEAPAQPVWGAPPDVELTMTNPDRPAFPIPPNAVASSADDADSAQPAGRSEQDLAALAIGWGALRIRQPTSDDPGAGDNTGGSSDRANRVVVRGAPSIHALMARPPAGLAVGAGIVAVVVVAVLTYTVGLPIAVVIGATVVVAAVAAVLCGRLIRPSMIADEAGVRSLGQSPAGRFAWADVVHVEPRYIDASHAIVVLHTATGATELTATAADPTAVAELARRLDDFRVRARANPSHRAQH